MKNAVISSFLVSNIVLSQQIIPDTALVIVRVNLLPLTSGFTEADHTSNVQSVFVTAAASRLQRESIQVRHKARVSNTSWTRFELINPVRREGAEGCETVFMLSPTPTSAQPSFTPFSINKYFVTLVQTSVVDCQVQKKSERGHKMRSVKIVKGKSPWCG